MAKIAVIIDDMFEDAEYTRPAEAFKKEGHQLIHVGLKEGKEVKGKKKGMTRWKSIVQDIKNADALYEDREVVVDGNLISSRQPSDIPAFVKAALERLH